MRAELRAVGAASLLMAGWPAGGSQPLTPPLALRAVESGEWELRARGESDPGIPGKLCISDPRRLLQVRHGGKNCKSFVISDAPGRVVVSYECGAAGNGRTDIRVETPRLVQIHSQGIADGAPFSLALEGRRIGVCR